MKIFNGNPGQLFAWLTIMALLLPGMTRADDDDSNRIFFFGDSLSDPGNVNLLLEQFSMTSVTEPPFDLVDDLIPGAPYNFRGFQFTNGKTWAQRFARQLETRRSGKAALAKPIKFTNYAYGGATARFEGNFRSGPEQVSQYKADFPGSADSDALYVIQFGGNDIRAALEALPDQAAAGAIVGMAVTSEFDMILDLYQKGARKFLVFNVPDLSLTPAINIADAQSAMAGVTDPGDITGAANQLVVSYNLGLEAALNGLEQLFPDISIQRLDIFGILNDIVANPDTYGIDDTMFPCINYNKPIEESFCDKPNRYVFWDGIHPTKKVHRIVSEIAVDLYDDDEDDDENDD